MEKKKRKLYFLKPLASQDILVLAEILVLLVVLQLMNRDFAEQKNLPSNRRPIVHQNHRGGMAELKWR